MENCPKWLSFPIQQIVEKMLPAYDSYSAKEFHQACDCLSWWEMDNIF
jgi:hypothetical protein